MSTKKVVRVSSEELKNRLLALKGIGVLKDVSARGKLSDSQKTTVRRNWKKYSDIAEAKKGSYVKQDVSYFSSQEKKALQDNGYKIINGKAFIDKEGNKTAKIRRVGKYITLPGEKKQHYESFIVVDRVDETGRKWEREFAGTSIKVNTWQEKMIAQYEAGEFGKGEFIGVKIGEGGVFRRRLYQSINDLFKYMDEDFEPKDARTDKNMLLNKIRLVKITVKDYRDLALTEKTKKQVNSDRYQRSKRRKELGVVKSKSKNKLVGKPRRK
jgi:hypothetical protein